jgi:SAM-dependent methyltransferase
LTSSWDGAVNFSSYDAVEAASNYATEAELDAYRVERLRRYKPHVELLQKLGVPDGGLRVVDVGSGSSAFLYALERAGILAQGIGIELSRSRHEFAERWRTDTGFERVTNVLGDFAGTQLPPASVDRFTVLDDTYLLLRPEDGSYPELLLDLAYRALVPGGLFIAAFRNDAPLAADMANGERSFWVELPESNAFRYALYRQQVSADGRTLRNESIYITRDLQETRKVEITEVCDVGALAAHLEQSGFATPALYEGFSMNEFDLEHSAQVVVLAKK